MTVASLIPRGWYAERPSLFTSLYASAAAPKGSPSPGSLGLGGAFSFFGAAFFSSAMTTAARIALCGRTDSGGAKADAAPTRAAAVSKRRAGIEEIPETRSSFDETTSSNLYDCPNWKVGHAFFGKLWTARALRLPDGDTPPGPQSSAFLSFPRAVSARRGLGTEACEHLVPPRPPHTHKARHPRVLSRLRAPLLSALDASVRAGSLLP